MKKINSISASTSVSTSIGTDNRQDSKLLGLQGQSKTYFQGLLRLKENGD